jgi:hypothetical protein
LIIQSIGMIIHTTPPVFLAMTLRANGYDIQKVIIRIAVVMMIMNCLTWAMDTLSGTSLGQIAPVNRMGNSRSRLAPLWMVAPMVTRLFANIFRVTRLPFPDRFYRCLSTPVCILVLSHRPTEAWLTVRLQIITRRSVLKELVYRLDRFAFRTPLFTLAQKFGRLPFEQSGLTWLPLLSPLNFGGKTDLAGMLIPIRVFNIAPKFS